MRTQWWLGVHLHDTYVNLFESYNIVCNRMAPLLQASTRRAGTEGDGRTDDDTKFRRSFAVNTAETIASLRPPYFQSSVFMMDQSRTAGVTLMSSWDGP